jgi:hypothetical protein
VALPIELAPAPGAHGPVENAKSAVITDGSGVRGLAYPAGGLGEIEVPQIGLHPLHQLLKGPCAVHLNTVTNKNDTVKLGGRWLRQVEASSASGAPRLISHDRRTVPVTSSPMGLLGLFNSDLTERKVKAARKRFWTLARREAVRHGRNEVWYADVVGCCLADEEVRTTLASIGHDPDALTTRVATFQSPDERSDVAARSGAFVVTQDQFSWPLDRAFDRAVAARRRQHAGTVRALDVLIGALSSDEQDLAQHIIEDAYALHLALGWEVAHPGVAQQADPPEGAAALVLYPDPFTPPDFVKRQLQLVPDLDDSRLGRALAAFEKRERAIVADGDAALLAGIRGHIARERALLGHPLRVEVEAA